MGLLDVLDFHYGATSCESSEVEYRLLSWGEIYPPFLGNREHSTAAQFILHDFPFKLFSVSVPYSEVPQKLCLTFRAPNKARKSRIITSSGIYPHEVAKEFAAFMSLLTRRRIFAVGQTRANGLPVDQNVDIYGRSHFQERQRLKEVDPKEIDRLLKNLQQLDERIARGFILAMRLYHAAVEMFYAEPEFAYLFLVMSIETISSAVYKEILPIDDEKENDELNHYLDSTYPGWRKHCDITDDAKRKQVINMLLNNAYFSRRKFRTFVCENVPDKFWAEAEDDAKPEHIYSVVTAGPNGHGKEEIRRSDMITQQWDKIQKDKLLKTLNRIYDTRSKFVHEGIRFPVHIVIGHFMKISNDAQNQLMTSMLEAGHPEDFFLDVPPLLTFERLVSYVMVEYLMKQDQSP